MPRRKGRNKRQDLPEWVKQATNEYKAHTESLCAFIREHDVPTDGHRNFDRAALKVLDVLTAPIPPAIFDILDKAIETRDRVSQYFAEQKRIAGIEPSDSDYDHRSFTEKLKTVRRIWLESQESTALGPESIRENHTSGNEDIAHLNAAMSMLAVETPRNSGKLTPLFERVVTEEEPYILSINVPFRTIRVWHPLHQLWVSWNHVEHIAHVKSELSRYILDGLPVKVALTDSKGQYWLCRWQIHSFIRLDADWNHYERYSPSSALTFPDPRSIEVNPRQISDFVDYCELKERAHLQWCSTPSKPPTVGRRYSKILTRKWWEMFNCDPPSKRRYLMHTNFSISEDDEDDYVTVWRQGSDEYLNCTINEARKILEVLSARGESASYWIPELDPITLEVDDRYFFDRPQSLAGGTPEIATIIEQWESSEGMWPETDASYEYNERARVLENAKPRTPREQELRLMEYFATGTANHESQRWGY